MMNGTVNSGWAAGATRLARSAAVVAAMLIGLAGTPAPADTGGRVLGEAWGYVFEVESEEDGVVSVRSTWPSADGGAPVETRGEVPADELPGHVARWGMSLTIGRLLAGELAVEVPPEEAARIQRQLEEAGERIPFSEDIRLINERVMEGVEAARTLDSPSRADVEEIFEALWDDELAMSISVAYAGAMGADDGPLSPAEQREAWDTIITNVAANLPDFCCAPVTREEHDQMARKEVRTMVARLHAANQLIEAYDLMRSEPLRAEAERIVAERGRGEDPEWALRAMLLEREWVRYQVDMAEHHVVFHDEEVEEAVRREWVDQRATRAGHALDRHTSVLFMPMHAPSVEYRLGGLAGL